MKHDLFNLETLVRKIPNARLHTSFHNITRSKTSGPKLQRWLFNDGTRTLYTHRRHPSEAQALIMHETLVIACHEGLKNIRHGFGNLSSQVEVLCRQHNIAPQDIVAIQKMRRHSNSIAPILPEDVAYDCRALAIFVSAIFQEAIPSFLVGKIPTHGRMTENIQLTNYRYIRCIVKEWDEKTIRVSVTNQAVKSC